MEAKFYKSVRHLVKNFMFSGFKTHIIPYIPETPAFLLLLLLLFMIYFSLAHNKHKTQVLNY